jgi:hypothetical protein
MSDLKNNLQPEGQPATAWRCGTCNRHTIVSQKVPDETCPKCGRLNWFSLKDPAAPEETGPGAYDIGRHGGPAYPVSIAGCGDNGWHGMTMRDAFAIAALQGMLAAGGVPLHLREDETIGENRARDAYAYADAMLAHRQKG